MCLVVQKCGAGDIVDGEEDEDDVEVDEDEDDESGDVEEEEEEDDIEVSVVVSDTVESGSDSSLCCRWVTGCYRGMRNNWLSC